MEMPQLTEAHTVFKKFVGSWQGEEKISPSEWTPEGTVALGQIKNQIALNGFILIQDMAQWRDGEVAYRAHNLFRWDEGDQRYVLHWFDSVGFPPNELQGQYLDGQLTFVGQDPGGHSRLVYDFNELDQIAFQMEASSDGESWQTLIEAVYHRD